MTKITNVSPGPRGIHTKEGLVFLDPWETRDVEVDDKALKTALDTGWFAKGEKKAPGDEGDSEEVTSLKRELAARDQEILALRTQLETLQQPPASTATFEAKHRGAGSYSVHDADGNEVIEKLSKADADAFNAMSDEDKAAYVDAAKSK